MAILDWIAANLGSFVHVLPWTWPIAEALHFLGLCLLIGSLIVIDLRMMGFNRGLSAVSAHELITLVWIGFSINFLTGIVFYVGDPHRYTPNIAFQLKMILVVLAGLNALYYQRKIAPEMASWTEDTAPPTNARVVGALSLVFWFTVLSYGRLIPYLGTG